VPLFLKAASLFCQRPTVVSQPGFREKPAPQAPASSFQVRMLPFFFVNCALGNLVFPSLHNVPESHSLGYLSLPPSKFSVAFSAHHYLSHPFFSMIFIEFKDKPVTFLLSLTCLINSTRLIHIPPLVFGVPPPQLITFRFIFLEPRQSLRGEILDLKLGGWLGSPFLGYPKFVFSKATRLLRIWEPLPPLLNFPRISNGKRKCSAFITLLPTYVASNERASLDTDSHALCSFPHEKEWLKVRPRSIPSQIGRTPLDPFSI